MTYGSSNPPAVSAGMQHPGFDRNAAALTGKKHLMRQTTIETSGPPGKKRRVAVRSSKKTVNSLTTSSNREEEIIYDKQLLANMGPQRLTGLTMNLGKRLGHVPSVERFLKNLVQSGKVISQWNGSFHADVDERIVSMQVFRHRFSADSSTTNDGNLVQTTYPTVTGTAIGSPEVPMILLPNNTSVDASTNGQGFHVTNPAKSLSYNDSHFQTAPAPGDVIKNAFYDHWCGNVAFCAINRPDLEDMSWNLNKLKLKNQPSVIQATDSVGVDFHNNVGPYHIDKHRRQSILQQNNFYFTDPLDVANAAGDGAPVAGALTSPYVFDANLRHGLIEYDFMNKNDTGCTIEVIVYRVKKTATLSPQSTSYSSIYYLDPEQTNPSSPSTTNLKCQYPLNLLVTSIGKGYMNTIIDKWSSENLQGRVPSILDIYSSPAYPLLPKLKKTIESTNPFVEVMRNKFVLTSGSRRSLDIKLPGVLYNPCSIPLTTVHYSGAMTSPNLDSTGQGYSLVNGVAPFGQKQINSDCIPCIDEHSYAVVIAVNGQKMTRFFDSKPKASNTEFTVRYFTGQGSGLDSANPPYPYMWFLPYDSTDPLSQQSGSQYITTYRLAYNEPGGTPQEDIVVTDATVDVRFADYTDPAPPAYPAPTFGGDTYDRFIYLSNFLMNGYNMVPARQYYLVGLPSTLNNSVLVGPLQIVYVYLDKSTFIPAQVPTELPMGDNHGSCMVDYCAKYTEHLGACVYKDPKEKILYTGGQPLPPAMKAGGTTGSVTSSRLVLPATSVVRQQVRASATYTTAGPQSVSVEEDVGLNPINL